MAHHEGKMRLGYMMGPYGNHTAAWKSPQVDYLKANDISYYKKIAKTLKSAKFDVLFVADFPSLLDGPFQNVSRSQFGENVLEPLTPLSALVGATEQIGLVGTASASYCEAYKVARSFASLDHISSDRVGWSAVTTRWRVAAANFGADDLNQQGQCYRRAVEFVDVVRKLWAFGDVDAFVENHTDGRYFDTSKMHLINHEGRSFKVRGPLNIARSPQGHPLITQAGLSGDGKDLAASSANLVLSITGSTEAAQVYYDDLKARAAALVRNPDDLKVTTGITVVVAHTTEEAYAKAEQVSLGLREDLGRYFVSQVLDINLECNAYDSANLAAMTSVTWSQGQTYFAAIRKMAVDDAGTLRQNLGPSDVANVSSAQDIKSALTQLETMQREGAKRYPFNAVTYLPVIPNRDKIFSIGTNSATHFKEIGRPAPAHPVVLPGFANSQIGAENDILRPKDSEEMDFEGELAVVIGKVGGRIALENALDHLAAYACYNDGSIRVWQRHTSQFAPGKNFRGTGTFGPWMVTKNEVPDPFRLELSTRLNGEIMQSVPNSDLI